MQKYSINVTSTAVAGLVLAVLSALGVRFPEDTSAFAVVGIASLATVIFFAAFISLKALFSMLLARWLIEIGACSLFGLLTVWIFADQCSFRNLDKHLPEVVWQLSDEGLAAVRQHVLITGASNWGALLDSLLLSVGVCYAAYLMGAMPIAALHIKITRKCALVLACGAVFTLMVVQRLAPYLMSESLGHACSRDAPWLFPTQKRSMPLLAGTAAVRSNVLVTSNQEPSISLNSVSDPDFVLIVIESLRMDAVTREIMPFLYARWKSGVRPSQSLAAANVTHVSLFSLLTTESPFLYYQFRMNQSLWGSRPLTQMRARGYELHAVSSSDLSYRYIAQIGFGGDYQLLTSNAAYFQNQELKVFEKDLAGAKRMKDILSKTRERPVIAFWFIEATHHDYSFPKKGDPSLSELSVFKRSGISKAESEAWKKRYLRAAKFVDGTVKDLVESLEGRDRRTIIGIVGDHGEEFGEAGYFWHGTSLTKYQINTPMVLFELGKSQIPAGEEMLGSHQDVLPTMFAMGDVEGISFGTSARDWTASPVLRILPVVDGNGGRLPWRWCLLHGNYKYWMQFRRDGFTASSQPVYVTKITTLEDETVLKPELERAIRGISDWTEKNLSEIGLQLELGRRR